MATFVLVHGGWHGSWCWKRVRALSYVDAFVPEDGKAAFDYLLPERAAFFRQRATEVGEGWKLPPPPGQAYNVNTADLDWMNRQCTPQPLATLAAPLRLRGPTGRGKRVAMILAGGYVNSPFRQFAATAEAHGWPMMTLPGGHDLMLDCPEEPVRELIAAGGAAPYIPHCGGGL